MGTEVGEGAISFFFVGSAQMRPNQALDVHVEEEATVEEARDSDSVVVVMMTDVTVAVRGSVIVFTGSRQPSHPGLEQVVAWLLDDL